jgi:NAD(P)-dependent dehydrogenase (short-subunit alcohol dehydrogenase family)
MMRRSAHSSEWRVSVGRLDGLIAVVTGGGRGIGRACALRFAREGAKVVVSARTETELDAVVAEIAELGGQALAVVADAMERDSARAPVREAIERFGRIDVLVNNVGGCIGMHDAFTGGDDSFEETIVLNVHSAWWATSAALPAMRERGFGRVINIGSTESLRANEGGPTAYVVGKHAIVGLTRQLGRDVGDSGITVNCICPGWTNTSMVDFESTAQYFGTTAAEARAYAEQQCAQNRIMEADEIADAALFLASSEAARITGQVLSVDGGYRL